MHVGDNTRVRELTSVLQAVRASLACRNVFFFVIASEEDVVESTLWRAGKDRVKSRVGRQAIELVNSLLYKRSTFDLDDASEARGHEEEVQSLVLLPNLFS